MRAIRRLTVRPVLPDSLKPLGELAANLRWSWHQPTQQVFAAMESKASARRDSMGRDPLRLLNDVPAERLQRLAEDEPFLEQVRAAHGDLQRYRSEPRWYQGADVPADAPQAIGYFSPEFGVTHVLPQYSGGLGILAGDHLKAASDLGVPIVGVGLLYRQGYFDQALTRAGWQQEGYRSLDADGLPLSRLRDVSGDPVRIHVGLPGGRAVVAAVWVAQVGRVPLLLLDSPDVTDRLYGGGTEHRLVQEMLLGIGGVRALRAFSAATGAPEPTVYHSNEGHAGFLGLERIREYVEDHGLAFDAALEATRAGTVFTTHTPVPAGIDRFPRSLVQQYLGGDNASAGVPIEAVLDLGAESPAGDPDVFNMALMGLRLAQRANGVSALHGQVSRTMFAHLWPTFEVDEVPITSITNGVHAPTWVAPEVSELVERGEDWTDAELWSVKHRLRKRLVADVRRRLADSWRGRGATDAELGWVSQVLDPDVLTIGFARRVPSYKRLTLMLRDPARLRALLVDAERPLQLVVAGKAHPADDTGKALIAELVRFADDPAVRHRIVFLPNYDMGMARDLYPGCDIWLNNPLRPYEACGTSGMKAALNGALNLSILDGWWAEWFDGDNGWAIPSAEGLAEEDQRDELEAAALYDLLEREVLPRFYDVDDTGVPGRWLEMVRHSMTSLGPKVQATRMVRDYVGDLYAPASAAARAMTAAGHAGARELSAWKSRVRSGWPAVAIEHIETGVADVYERGGSLPLQAYVALGQLDPGEVTVQALHGRVGDNDELSEPVATPLRLAESYDAGRHRFEGHVPLDRTGPFGYTVRVVPRHEWLASDAEMGLAVLPLSGVGPGAGE